MSELERAKDIILQNMQKLCAHCLSGNLDHNCPIKPISEQLLRIKGIPLIVNDEFRGMIFR